VDYFRYFSILIQAMAVNLDEEFLLKVIHFAQKVTQMLPQQNSDKFQLASKMVYFELLHLNPIRVNFSFMPSSDQNLDSAERYLLGVSKQILGRVDGAPLKLNLLLLKHAFSSREDLFGRIYSHYLAQAKLQVFKVLG